MQQYLLKKLKIKEKYLAEMNSYLTPMEQINVIGSIVTTTNKKEIDHSDGFL
jgi:hypothetical protein